MPPRRLPQLAAVIFFQHRQYRHCQPLTLAPSQQAIENALVRRRAISLLRLNRTTCVLSLNSKDPLPAHPYRQHNRAPVHLVHPSVTVRVPAIAKLALRPHPTIPLQNIRPHLVDREPAPQPPQIRLTLSNTQYRRSVPRAIEPPMPSMLRVQLTSASQIARERKQRASREICVRYL